MMMQVLVVVVSVFIKRNELPNCYGHPDTGRQSSGRSSAFIPVIMIHDTRKLVTILHGTILAVVLWFTGRPSVA